MTKIIQKADNLTQLKEFRNELDNMGKATRDNAVFDQALKFFGMVVSFQKKVSLKEIEKFKKSKEFLFTIKKILNDNVISVNLNGLFMQDYDSLGRISLNSIKKENSSDKRLMLSSLINYYNEALKNTLDIVISAQNIENKKASFLRSFSIFGQKQIV